MVRGTSAGRSWYRPAAELAGLALGAAVFTWLHNRRIPVVMAPLALLIFWLVPTSPPRFALPGIIDLVAALDLFGRTASVDLTNGQNHFSAMPSLHVGWSALCAYAAWLALRGRHPRLALLAWLFPAIMIAVVITTGNHYILDVAGSALLLTVSISVATAWKRNRHRPGTQACTIEQPDG